MTGNVTEKRGVAAVWVLSSIVALWTAAASVEITAQRWGRVLARLGDAYPVPTAWALGSARLDLAWWVAAAGTVTLVVLWLRRSRLCLEACAVALFASAIGASVAALALTLVLDTGPAILLGPPSDGRPHPGPLRTCESGARLCTGSVQGS